MAIRIFHKDEPDLRMPMIAKDARLVVWLGVGSKTANMNYVDMQPGERNVPHAHMDSEDTIFILDGAGTAEDLTNNVTYEVCAGQIVHIPAGIVHALHADKGERIESIGGPAPADESMLKKMGIEPPAIPETAESG